MKEQGIDSETTGYQTDNKGFTEANALQIRLGTEQLLDRIENYLKGTIYIQKESSEGNLYLQEISVCEPKANNHGVYSIMSILRGLINPSMVQGNLEKFEDLDNLISNTRADLSSTIMINLCDYEVKDSDFEGLIDFIMIQLRLFLSRLVGNEERKSFANTITHNENTSHQEKKTGGWGLNIRGLRG